jgi:hypothetical protein
MRARWCKIIILNVQAPRQEKSNNSKDNFYEELGQVFNHFTTHHATIMLGDFNEKFEKEDI